MPAELEAGTVLSGTYRIRNKIAEGGMGVVYEAEHLRLTGRRVAVKVMLGMHRPDSEKALRFRREAEICSRLTHPHIVSVTDWDTLDNGAAYFVMEFLDGESLADRMNQGPIPREQVMKILRQIGAALDAAHRQGIVHRDLKPSNVFLVSSVSSDDQDVFVKVLDFGISKDLTEQTLKVTQSTILGSPRHMSPEQARGLNDRIDARSDQFSLATMAYEMFCRQPAFAADTVESTLYKIVHDEPKPLGPMLPDLPAHVAVAVERALDKEPVRRFASIPAFIRALDGVPEPASRGPGLGLRRQASVPTVDIAPPQAAGEPAPTVDDRPRTARPVVGRSGWLLGLGLVLAVGGGAGLLVYWLGQEQGAGAGAATGAGNPAADTGVQAFPGDGGEVAGRETDGGTGAHQVTDARVAGEGGADHTGPFATGRTRDEGRDAGRSSRPPPGASRSPPAEEIAPEAAVRLKEAATRFRQGRYRDCIRMARQSIIMQDTARARELITMGYCALGDLGNARASLYAVPVSRKKRVVQRCRELGLNL